MHIHHPLDDEVCSCYLTVADFELSSLQHVSSLCLQVAGHLTLRFFLQHIKEQIAVNVFCLLLQLLDESV